MWRMKKGRLFGGMLVIGLIFGSITLGCDNGDTTSTFVVQFDPGEGSGAAPATQTVSAGANIFLPGQSGMVPPTGRSFTGWRAEGQNFSSGDNVIINGNVIFIAQWGTGVLPPTPPTPQPPTQPTPQPPTGPQQPTTLVQAHALFIERVGSGNASLFPQSRFTWNNSTGTLTYMSRQRDFSLSPQDWFVSRKEMEVRFVSGVITSASWRYVISTASVLLSAQLGLGNPTTANPFRGSWNTTAVIGNGVSGTGVTGVLNTLIHFEQLAVGDDYVFASFTYRVAGVRN